MIAGLSARAVSGALAALDSTTELVLQDTVPAATLPLAVLAQGMFVGAFVTLAGLAALRSARWRSYRYAWLALTALCAAGFQITLGHAGDPAPLGQRWLHSPATEVLAGAALALAALGLARSAASPHTPWHSAVGTAVFAATAIVLMCVAAWWLPYTAGQLALLLAAGACACFALLSARLHETSPLAAPLVCTSVSALIQLLLRLDGVAMFLPRPPGPDAALPTLEAEYLVSGLANLAVLAMWLRYLGRDSPVPPAWLGHLPAAKPASVGTADDLQASVDAPTDPEVARHTASLMQEVAGVRSRANQRIQTLSYVAHDLRAPLATIMGYVRLMRSSATPVRADYLDAIQRSVDFQLSLVDDILEYSKAELSPLYLAPVDTHLPKLLSEIAASGRMLCRSDSRRFVYTAPELMPARVEVDGRRLQQVLLNLLSNAAKFTPRGNISLIVDAHPDPASPHWRLSFCVKDQGFGIEPADQEKIFEAYAQLERSHGGVGLGLLISSRIVESMGGRLNVNSMPGQGSEFSFELDLPTVDATLVPAYPDPGAEQEPAAQYAGLSVPPSAARLELAILVRDGRLTDIEDWLARALHWHPGFDEYYTEVRDAVQSLDLVRLEKLALLESGQPTQS